MSVKVNLPTTISVGDYHDFSYLQEQMRKVIPGVKICEIGLYCRDYVGVVYVGSKEDQEVKELIAKVKSKIKKEEQ